MNTEVITLAAIMNFFKEDSNTFEKGEKKFQADHVLKLEIQDLDIVDKVQASLKDRLYKVVLTVDGSGGIACAHCECPCGNWICSHMAAAAIYANKKGLSKTDLPNSWIARPKKHFVGDSRILLPDVTSCSDFRHALFDCYVDLLSTPLLVLSLHVVFSISALLYSTLARGMQTSERQY